MWVLNKKTKIKWDIDEKNKSLIKMIQKDDNFEIIKEVAKKPVKIKELSK